MINNKFIGPLWKNGSQVKNNDEKTVNTSFFESKNDNESQAHSQTALWSEDKTTEIGSFKRLSPDGELKPRVENKLNNIPAESKSQNNNINETKEYRNHIKKEIPLKKERQTELNEKLNKLLRSNLKNKNQTIPTNTKVNRYSGLPPILINKTERPLKVENEENEEYNHGIITENIERLSFLIDSIITQNTNNDTASYIALDQWASSDTDNRSAKDVIDQHK